MTCAALLDLPLFAHAAHAPSGALEGAVEPFWLTPSPGPRSQPRPTRQPKPQAPGGDAIWPDHSATIALPASAVLIAIRAAQSALAAPPKRGPKPDALVAAIRANAALCRAISQPDPMPADGPDLTDRGQGRAWIARTATTLEIVYRGAKEHLAVALSALADDRATLPVMARWTAAQLLPLRSASVARGVCGWRAIVPIRTLEASPTLGA